ncbi:doublecortin domain-containing protein [Mactra antiquata]
METYEIYMRNYGVKHVRFKIPQKLPNIEQNAGDKDIVDLVVNKLPDINSTSRPNPSIVVTPSQVEHDINQIDENPYTQVNLEADERVAEDNIVIVGVEDSSDDENESTSSNENNSKVSDENESKPSYKMAENTETSSHDIFSKSLPTPSANRPKTSYGRPGTTNRRPATGFRRNSKPKKATIPYKPRFASNYSKFGNVNNNKMSTVRWAESKKSRKIVTTTQQVNLKSQGHGGPGGLVSYEDLLIAQYLDELRNSRKNRQADEEPRPSPYAQKLPHSDYTYKYRTSARRPVSASNVGYGTAGKPKIDAKFIADPSLWDPATPRQNNDEGPETYQLIVTEKSLRSHARPASAPVKRNKLNRPTSAASTLSYYGRNRQWSSKSTYYGGRKIKSQYKKQPHTIRVTAFRNGSREVFVRWAAPSIKMLLEFCTDKLGLPFAARRIFLEDGIEVFHEKDIPMDGEVYISTGENYKDPYAVTKRNIILSNGAKWTLTGVMLPEEGKKKASKPRLSKRMKKLAEVKRVRIIVYRNGKCTEPVEIVADLSKLNEFLVACTGKLDLRSHAKILYDWEGNEITSLADTPILDECLQSGGTYVLGPVWVSTGESFSPSGTRDFLITIKEVLKARIKEAKVFRKELMFMKDGEEDNIKVAIKILSMSKEEVEEALIYTDRDIDQLSETLCSIDEKCNNLQEMVATEEVEGSNYKMRHIKTLSEGRSHKMLGTPGLKLKVHENGIITAPQDFYFNLRKATQGATKEIVLQRLLDEVSGLFCNPQNPKLAPIAKKIFNVYGRDIVDVFTLKTDDEIWVSFGENYISPFTYCIQVIFDKAKGRDVFGEKQVILREQLVPEDCSLPGFASYENYEASIGFPAMYEYEPCKYEGERDQIQALASMAELDARGHYLQFMMNPSKVLYPEIIVNHKLPKGHKELWPSESQIWVVSKSGFIYIKPFPQLCLAVTDIKTETNLIGMDTKVTGYVVSLQKKMVGNPHQLWTFNPDATITSKAYPELLLTYLGKKFGEETEDSTQPEGVLPGTRVYLVLSDPLTKKAKTLQRFALKQEKFGNLGQWKYNDATNPEWNKQALSWPVKSDGSLNMDYDWPMEGFILPFAPKLHKKKGENDLCGMVPIRLLVVKNGERNLTLATPVVGPNLTNFMKDLTKKPARQEKKNRRRQQEEQTQDNSGDNIELDVNLHCRDLTIRELEFIMFLDHCTLRLDLPFAGRRLFDEHGNEHLSLKTLKRDQLVYVSCGEIWTDPNLTKAEQQRRYLLSQISQDVAKLRQYASLRNPERYVLEVDASQAPSTPVIVNKQWSKDEEDIDLDRQSLASGKPPTIESSGPHTQNVDETSGHKTYHQVAHERSEQRLNNLKWPWERLVNVNNSFDADPEANKYTDRELYEKYKPKTVAKISRDTLQRFVFEDGYIALNNNKQLVLGVSEPEGRVIEVHLVKRRPDDIYQQWCMKENGEIRPRHSTQTVLTVSMPNNEPFAEDEDGRPLTFVGCKVTLQSRRNNEFGKAHQRWRYDAETGFVHAFYADLPDKEITAANKADVCTYAIANTSKIDQPGYCAEVPLQTASDRASMRRIKVCMSCARAMRGRYKISRLPDNTQFSCAMGHAKQLGLQQIGSFRVLNGKVDLSTHEYELTLQDWEERLNKLSEETSSRVITKEINVAKTIQTVKVLAYKNGEGRLRPGEIICGSSVIGILNQCTLRLGLNQAAVRMYTEDGSMIVEVEDLVDWAIQNYRNLMADHLEKLYQGKQDDDENLQRGEGEGQEKEGEGQDEDEAEGQDKAETDQKESDKTSRQREYLLSQVRMPSEETILRYPIEIWVSSGKPFVAPEVVESKIENRKKKRAFRSAVSLELDIEKHVLRQMKGRRLDELSPGEYRGTKNSNKPVIVEGHWEEPSPEEQQKHDTVHKLEEHLAEVKYHQKEKTLPLQLDRKNILYRQPDTKRILAYPNGESVERATYIWGDTFQQLLDSATMRLNLWQPAKRFFDMEGREIFKYSDIKKDQVLCVSTNKPFKPTQTSRLDVEIKANWSRAHKQYGPTSTDVHVEAPANPKVNVDPFGPPALALPLTNDGTSSKPPRPVTAKPHNITPY